MTETFFVFDDIMYAPIENGPTSVPDRRCLLLFRDSRTPRDGGLVA